MDGPLNSILTESLSFLKGFSSSEVNEESSRVNIVLASENSILKRGRVGVEYLSQTTKQGIIFRVFFCIPSPLSILDLVIVSQLII